MPRLHIERDSNYRLNALIRGEMASQGWDIARAAKAARCSVGTLYKLFGAPMEHMPQAMRLLQALSVPIEDVRQAISY